MRANLDKALAYVFVSEGGFAQRPTEPGGAVNMGISLQAYAAWWVKLAATSGAPPDAPTIADLQKMTKEEAIAIYDTLYAEPIGFDALPSGVDYCALDAAVNEGVGWTKRIMQAMPVSAADDVIDFVCDTRLAGKRKRPQWVQFGRGWTSRIESVRKHAKEMVTP